MNPSTASIWLLHENPRFDRTASMIVFTCLLYTSDAADERSTHTFTQRLE